MIFELIVRFVLFNIKDFLYVYFFVKKSEYILFVFLYLLFFIIVILRFLIYL